MKKTATQQTEEKSKYKFISTKYECTKCGHIINVEYDTKISIDKNSLVCQCGCRKFKTKGETA